MAPAMVFLESVKPCHRSYGGLESVPTQASLTPFAEEEGVPWKVATACELSPTVSSNDLQSLGECESKCESKGESDEEEEGITVGTTSPLAQTSTTSRVAGPKFLSGLELSQLNWKKLANGREWRRELLLRGLPQHLCDRSRLEAFLVTKGLRELVTRIRVMPGKGLKPGSAILFAVSVEAVTALSRFFHGAQLPGARTPVAVGFAPGSLTNAGSRSEPMRVPTSMASSRALPAGVRPPPGLECWTCPF
uniref:Uncharacterized protein n=1 Tax=Alexandrium andersonii TaxID=327968 RepID=A0A7S2DZ87_9DINO